MEEKRHQTCVFVSRLILVLSLSNFVGSVGFFFRILSKMRTVWSSNSPDSLLDTVARFCINNLDVFKLHIKAAADSDVGIHLPLEIGEKLFQVEHYTVIINELININILTKGGSRAGQGYRRQVQSYIQEYNTGGTIALNNKKSDYNKISCKFRSIA